MLSSSEKAGRVPKLLDSFHDFVVDGWAMKSLTSGLRCYNSSPMRAFVDTSHRPLERWCPAGGVVDCCHGNACAGAWLDVTHFLEPLARTETLHMSLWERDWQVKSTVDDEEHQKFDLKEGYRLFAMSRKNCFYNA